MELTDLQFFKMASVNLILNLGFVSEVCAVVRKSITNIIQEAGY